MNYLSNLNETYRQYSLAPTDDLIRFWSSEVTAGLSMWWWRHPCRHWRIEFHLLVSFFVMLYFLVCIHNGVLYMTIRHQLTAWHSGRTPVFDRRTGPVPRSICSWRVTTCVGKTSAVGQRTRPTQPFILSGSINWVVSNFIGCVLVVPSGECSRG